MQSVLHGSLETLVFNTKDSVEIPVGSLPMQVPNTGEAPALEGEVS